MHSPSAATAAALPQRIAAQLARLDIASPRAAYVLRSTVAAWLALSVAYLLKLETPYSAASTVLLVINPIQGAVIGKGSWRVIGTVAGMLAAVLLMSAFAQMPWLFVLGFGAWLGVCVAGMTLLRHFRASGTVVAGYTVGLATFGALQNPASTFEHVIGRGSTVVVGVVCLGLVSALFSARHVRAQLEARLKTLAAGVADALAARQTSDASGDPRQRLVAELYGVDDLLALGNAESADLARRATAVRHAMAALFTALAGGPAQREAGALACLRSTLERAWRETARAIAGGDIEHARETMRRARAQIRDAAAASHDVSALIAAERLLEQIHDYDTALDGIAALRTARPPATKPALAFHRDVAGALRNGLRAMLTLVLAGAFWIATGWPHGDMMLLVVAPYCALLANAGNPAAGAFEFVKGTLAAVPMAFLCAFVVLPHLDGLPLLLVALALFWLPGIWATGTPRHGLAGLAYLVAFNTLTGAANPMQYDVALFLNWSVAWLLATFLTLLTFRVLLPRDAQRDVARLRRRIRDESLAVLRGARADRRAWPLRQQHRIALLGALLGAKPEARERAVADALAGLHLGRELLHLRHGLRELPHAQRDLVVAALRHIARRAADPVRAAHHAQRAARALLHVHPLSVPQRRLAAAFADVAALLRGHADYFTSSPRKAAHAQ